MHFWLILIVFLVKFFFLKTPLTHFSISFRIYLSCHGNFLFGNQRKRFWWKIIYSASVCRFISASKIVPRVRHDKLAYKFVLSRRNILARPEASICFQNFSIPISSSDNHNQMDMVWLSALTETGSNYHKISIQDNKLTWN